MKQVLPFIFKLPARGQDGNHGSTAADFFPVKGVPASKRLRMNRVEIRIYRADRILMLPETRELGMRSVSDSAAAKHSAGKESFPPYGCQPFLIKKNRMQCPKAHGRDSEKRGVARVSNS